MIILTDPEGREAARGTWGPDGLLYLVRRRGVCHFAAVPEENTQPLFLLVRRHGIAVAIRIASHCAVGENGALAFAFRDTVACQIGLARYGFTIHAPRRAARIIHWCAHHPWARWIVGGIALLLIIVTIGWGVRPIDPVAIAIRTAAQWERYE